MIDKYGRTWKLLVRQLRFFISSTLKIKNMEIDFYNAEVLYYRHDSFTPLFIYV